MESTGNDIRAIALIALLLLAAAAPPIQATVLLNEASIQGPEQVELYNFGPAPVNVDGWTIQGDGGAQVIGGVGLLNPGAYVIVAIAVDQFGDNGGFVELLDGALDDRDGVTYGNLGSAPLPPESTPFGRAGPASLARTPDGSSYTSVPPNSPASDGTFWSIDFTPTFGSANDAPTPLLGSSIILNEVDPKPVGGGDFVELFNPGGLGVSLGGWMLTNGRDLMTLSAVAFVPAGGFYTATTPVGFDVEETDLLYLFSADSVRVDQLGFDVPVVRSGPPLDTCLCYARFTDGTGPNLGYDWPTSGGFATLWTLECTLDASNVFIRECDPTSVGASVGDSTWGRIKALWRQ